MDIPEGYDHKATSDSFSEADAVSIYFSSTFNDYMVYVHANQECEGKTVYLSKEQLELVIHAGTDALEIDSR